MKSGLKNTLLVVGSLGLLFLVIIPSYVEWVWSPSTRTRAAIRDVVDDADEINSAGERQRSQPILNGFREAGNRIDFSKLEGRTTEIGRNGYGLELAYKKGMSTANNLRLLEAPDPIVEANYPGFRPIYCLNITTDRTQPCEFFPGDVIEAHGTVESPYVRETDTGQPVIMTPCGIPHDDGESSPYVRDMPRFALLGVMRHANGQRSKPFSLCEPYTVRDHAFLEAMVNGDYRDKFDQRHNEWFTDYKRSFKLRLKRSSQ